MNVIFRIRFHTHLGQSLWLRGGPPLPAHPVPMEFSDAEHWQIALPLSAPAAGATLSYSYELTNSDGSRVTDWGRDRKIVPADYNFAELFALDSWNDSDYVGNIFYTEPFKKVFLVENFREIRTVASPEKATHTFRVKWPLPKKNQTLCLLGEGAALGNWQTHSPLLLRHERDGNYFSATLDLRGQNFPLQYKYGVFDAEADSFVRFEDGPNRVLWDEIRPDKHTIVADGFVRLPLEQWRGAGVAIPVFSLRTENSFGVGEFADLKLFAAWGKKCGLKLIQLLPINDTSATGTWHDSYPYAAISAFALHPIYLNLAAVAEGQNQKLLAELEPDRQRLNSLDSLDYEAVMKIKVEFVRKIFPSQKTAAFQNPEYKKFFDDNKNWLLPYASFCFLRDKFGTADFNAWPEHQKFDVEKIAALANANDEIAFHCFVQFHLHAQLADAVAQVHANGLVLKGDIAIGVRRHGADVWQSPELFHLDVQAGAPPDAFSAKGQNWSFPTYNWPRMAAGGFAWWKQRLAQMGCYFDAFRIDHILGFFRIWSIPAHAVEGILGHFVPALPVEENEFAQRGIHFDRERLTKPFITDAVLKEIFGDDADFVRAEFLEPKPEVPNASTRQLFNASTFSLKPEFATQQQVEGFFSSQPKSERNEKLKIGMFDLISNVILLKANGGLHFRFFMDRTTSFEALPPEQQAKLKDLYVDYFFRRQDEFWKQQAMQKLPAFKRVTNMLICGEDLGLVPACVPEVMRDLLFLGLEVQRMPKRLGHEFSRPADAAYLSVVTPGTHDMSTIRGWWQEDRAAIQNFYNHELQFPGEAPSEAPPEIVQAIVQQHLLSPAMWSIFQLQDFAGMDAGLRRANIADERINVPGIPNFYWRYRMHRTIEVLLRADSFNLRLKQMIAEAGR